MAPGAFLGSNFGMAIEIHSRRDPITMTHLGSFLHIIPHSLLILTSNGDTQAQSWA